MGRLEIVEKLQTFLQKMPFTEECHVIYLLVEIRKILDREENKKYPLLRFYCDWSVHTAKDRITPEIKNLMSEIYLDVSEQMLNIYPLNKKVKIVSFSYMEDLQIEVGQFLQEYGLPQELVIKENWLEFVKLCVRVLSDQPINNPCIDIQRFSFIPAAKNCVGVRIDFTHKVGDFDYYQLRNAY